MERENFIKFSFVFFQSIFLFYNGRIKFIQSPWSNLCFPPIYLIQSWFRHLCESWKHPKSFAFFQEIQTAQTSVNFRLTEGQVFQFLILSIFHEEIYCWETLTLVLLLFHQNNDNLLRIFGFIPFSSLKYKNNEGNTRKWGE